MLDELVSIIIPVYNGSDYLRIAINSALAQTWPHIEVIVINDGSRDDGATRDVALAYADRIRYIEKENGGVASALNVGIQEMRGAYFSWLSHDDVYHHAKVELQMRAMAASGKTVVVYSDYDCIRADGSFMYRRRVGLPHDADHAIWAVLEGRLNGCCLLIPREVFQACGQFERGLYHSQDYDLWFRIAQSFDFLHVPGALVKHRVHEAQSSVSHRHIDEASLLWMRMLDGFAPSAMAESEGSEARFVLRAAAHLGQSGYAGAKVYMRERLDKELSKQGIGIGLAAGNERALRHALAALAALGGPQACTIVDATEAAMESLALVARSVLVGKRYLKYVAGDSSRRLVEGVVESIETSFIVLCSTNRLPSVAFIRSALETLLRDDSLGGVLADAGPPEDMLFGILEGSVLRRRAVLDALASSTDESGALELALAIASPLKVLHDPGMGEEALHPDPLARARPEKRRAEVDDAAVAVSAGLQAPSPADGASNDPAWSERLFELLGLSPGGTRPLLVIAFESGQRIDAYVSLIAGAARLQADIVVLRLCPDRAFAVFEASNRQAVVGLDEISLGLRSLGATRPLHVDLLSVGPATKSVLELASLLHSPYDVTIFEARDGGWRELTSWCDESRRPLLAGARRRVVWGRALAAKLAQAIPTEIFASHIAPRENPNVFKISTPSIGDDEALRVLITADDFACAPDLIVAVAEAAIAQECAVELMLLEARSMEVPSALQRDRTIVPLGDLPRDQLNLFVALARPHIHWSLDADAFRCAEFMMQGLPVAAREGGYATDILEGRPFTWILAETAGAAEWLDLFRTLRDSGFKAPAPGAFPSRPPWQTPYFAKDHFSSAVRDRAPPAEPGHATTPVLDISRSIA